LWFILTIVRAETLQGDGWSLELSDGWKIIEQTGDRTEGRVWELTNRDNHSASFREMPNVDSRTPQAAALDTFKSFEESEDNPSINDQGAAPGGWWIKMTGGGPMAQSGQAAWWFTLPGKKQLNASWQWTPGDVDEVQRKLIAGLVVGGKRVAPLERPAVVEKSVPGVTFEKMDPAKTSGQVPIAPVPVPKSTADLFADFDADYAAATDVVGRAVTIATYLKALRAGNAPEEKKEIFECVRRVRAADGANGLMHLLIRAPAEDTALIRAQLDGVERALIKALATSYVEQTNRDQQASIARVQAMTPAERTAIFTNPKTTTADKTSERTPEPPPYDLTDIRRRAFAGDRLAILDLGLHYGGVYDPALANVSASKYWTLRCAESGWDKPFKDLGNLKTDEDLLGVVKSLSKDGSLVAKAFMAMADQPEPFVSET